MSESPAPLPIRRSWLHGMLDRLWARTRAKLPRVVYANGGLGDELMLTAIAHAARLDGHPLHVVTARPEVWRDNHDPLSLQVDIERWHYAKRRGCIAAQIVHLLYRAGGPEHIAARMAKCTGVALPPGWWPVY